MPHDNDRCILQMVSSVSAKKLVNVSETFARTSTAERKQNGGHRKAEFGVKGGQIRKPLMLASERQRKLLIIFLHVLEFLAPPSAGPLRTTRLHLLKK